MFLFTVSAESDTLAVEFEKVLIVLNITLHLFV